ncbi:MAG: periplasmic heavy metal sensor [Caulobacterales bacterium]|nr:periplasmic heavy metal sensor [Caulobacterales bacterium]
MPRWLLPAALFVSLALNVFVVGAVVGVRLAADRAEHAALLQQQQRRPAPLQIAVRSLPPEAQAAWRAQMPAYTAVYAPKTREARQLLAQTVESFGHDPFDAQATLANLEKVRAAEGEARHEMDRRIVAFAATLPADQRARFGLALARPAQAQPRPAAGN